MHRCIDTPAPRPRRPRPSPDSWKGTASRPGEANGQFASPQRSRANQPFAPSRPPGRIDRQLEKDAAPTRVGFDVPLGIQSWIKDGSRLVLHHAVRKRGVRGKTGAVGNGEEGWLGARGWKTAQETVAGTYTSIHPVRSRSGVFYHTPRASAVRSGLPCCPFAASAEGRGSRVATG